jgi:LPS-assembly lipoprotein
MAAAVLSLGLGGCGFRPMYGTASNEPMVGDDLASISIDPIADRQGQLLHNALLTRLTPKGETQRPRYRLHVLLTMWESQQVIRSDATASRAADVYTASYNLVERDAKGSETVIAYGVVQRTLSYDFLTQHYADISAAEDIRSRAAEVIADEIRNEVAAYFIRRRQARGGLPPDTP